MNDTITCTGEVIWDNNVTIIGDENTIKGNECIVKGNRNIVQGNDCDVYGNSNHIYGSRTNVYGDWNMNLNDDYKLCQTNAGRGKMNSGSQSGFDHPMNVRTKKVEEKKLEEKKLEEDKLLSFTDINGQRKETLASEMIKVIKENKEQDEQLVAIEEFQENQRKELQKKQTADFELFIVTLYQQIVVDKAKIQQSQVEKLLKQAHEMEAERQNKEKNEKQQEQFRQMQMMMQYMTKMPTQ